ncbi:thiol reductant ABC exporter subunit CydD [Subtercola vilae]|uniref:Thiol reductant ABC exporter subunit CydD n=1 Tax=Subtercola vilae TaxID=2056433 RepID=A0A4T2BIN6_9MICO|nr:thiol reductant ABC exporter subunit CydD [Subtercola vilae]TIH30589.1 thiol reductant ABC exporter subunit CydD [Subtercola vilae]
MKPVDPRLLRYAGAARAFFGFGAVLGLAQTACIVAFAWLVSSSVVDALHGATPFGWRLVALVAVVLLRSVLVWMMEWNSARGATIAKSQLRQQVLRALPRLGPSWLSTRSSAAVTTTLTTGLDALDVYFARYLPQLILTALATPILVAVLFLFDFASGITVLLTLPLIPVFMILIGWATQTAQKEQWLKLGRLSSGFLDVVEGLSTLKVFGRADRQVTRIRSVTEEYRASTMKVLRLSFLSGFALELAASLSVALVAVSVGLRLVSGDLGLGVGLFVLLLAPEAFLPLRQVGAQFHAAADGVEATEEVFAMLAGAGAGVAVAEGARDADGTAGSPTGSRADGRLVVNDLTVMYADTAAVRRFSAEFAAGQLSVIVGPSGAGKSSIVAAMLGFVPFGGSIELVGSGDSSERKASMGLTARPLGRADVAWAGQVPGLMAATVGENVTLGSEHPSPALVTRALALAAADAPDPALAPSNRLGVNGAGLSGGQAQRVAVARAIYRALERGCRVLVLDEPSSALDRETEARLIAGLGQLVADGMVVVVVSHREAFRAAAAHVVRVGAPIAARTVTPAAAPGTPTGTRRIAVR